MKQTNASKKHKLSKSTQYEIHNLISLTTIKENNFVILITGAVVLCSMNKDFDQFIYEDNSFNINIWADLHVLRKLKWLVSVFGML